MAGKGGEALGFWQYDRRRAAAVVSRQWNPPPTSQRIITKWQFTGYTTNQRIHCLKGPKVEEREMFRILLEPRGITCAPGCASLKRTYDEMYYYYYTEIPCTRNMVPGTYEYSFFLAVAPDADHPTRTRTVTLTRTLWGDLCLEAVACEDSRLIRPKGDAVDGGCVFQNSRTRVCLYFRLEPARRRSEKRVSKRSNGCGKICSASEIRNGRQNSVR